MAEQYHECEDCGGSGDCCWCQGEGEIVSKDKEGIATRVLQCEDCQGSGDCQTCKGRGAVENED